MKIQFLPMNQRIEVEAGTNLLEAAWECGITMNAVCSGNGTCGKCKVLVTKGNQKDYDEIEIKQLTNEELESGMRLACRIKVDEDITVIVPSESRNKQKNKEFLEVKRTNDIINSKEKDKNGNYGVAIDIGTTTVEACLYNMDTKLKLVRLTKENPQKVFGADVISRITYSNKSTKNLEKLQELIINCCNSIISELLETCNIINKNYVKEVIVVANTTMSHIFLGKSVMGLAKSPFEPAYKGMVRHLNHEQKLLMNPEAEIILLPGISGHVGSDTLGGILATNLSHQKGVHILIDIGTNGELVLSKDGDLICCSTAAGPAFEGASILQGMRAVKGAIKGVNIIGEDISLDVIGETEAIGICGSGIIDAIAELKKAGIIDKTGRILSREEVNSPLARHIMEEDGMQFLLSSSYHGNRVVITQQDIREVQLAKAAIYSGTVSLLCEAGAAIKDIDRLYLAGSFGSNLKIKNAIEIGLLPRMDSNKIILIGNGALDGAIKVLLADIPISEVTIVSENIKHIELANSEEFQRRFIEAINFE